MRISISSPKARSSARSVRAGQRCTSTSRLVVHRDVATDLVDALQARAAKLVLGDPVAPGTDVGPVIDRTRPNDRAHGRNGNR